MKLVRETVLKMKLKQSHFKWLIWCRFYNGFVNKDLGLFIKLAEEYNIPIRLAIYKKIFKRGINELGKDHLVQVL